MAAVPRQTRRSCITAARQNRQSETASAIAAAVQQACNFDELQRLIELLPTRFQDSLQRQPHLHDLIEIVLDLGRQPVARFPQSYVALSGDNVSEEDIETAVSKVMPAVADCSCLKRRAWQLPTTACPARDAALTIVLHCAQVSDFGDDNRAGIDRTLHRISCLRNRSVAKRPKCCPPLL